MMQSFVAQHGFTTIARDSHLHSLLHKFAVYTRIFHKVCAFDHYQGLLIEQTYHVCETTHFLDQQQNSPHLCDLASQQQQK